MSKICYILAIDEESQYLIEDDNGKKRIRNVQEAFEKHFPVFTVTQHAEVTGWVCDYIAPPGVDKTEIVLNLERADVTIIVDGSRTYSEDDVLKHLNDKGVYLV